MTEVITAPHYFLLQLFTSRKNLRKKFRSYKRNIIILVNDEDEKRRLISEIERKTNHLYHNEIERRIIQLYSFGKVLDVGCGPNKLGDIGIDVNRDSTADVLSDAQLLPFQSQSFDCVVCHHVLEHLPQYGKALLEMYRVAKSHVIIVVPRYKNSFVHHQHIHHFKRDELKEVLERLFKIEDVFTVCTSNVFLCQKYKGEVQA